LKVLDLSQNSLRELPPFSLISRKNLQVLDIQSNSLTSIFGLSRLESLQELNASFNFIRKIQLPPNLIFFSASFNPLLNPPFGYQDEKLEELYLTGCALGMAPIFQNPKRLRVVYLGYNQLSEIPDFLFRAPLLKTLDLSFNNILDISAIKTLQNNNCDCYFSHQKIKSNSEKEKNEANKDSLSVERDREKESPEVINLENLKGYFENEKENCNCSWWRFIGSGRFT